MYSKYNEIESIVEDLIENTIVEYFEGCFSSKKQCKIALKVLIEQLDELDETVFDDLFDN